MSSSRLANFFTDRYRGLFILTVCAGMLVLMSSFKSQRKINKKTQRSATYFMSNEDLEFESQILIQRTKANEEFTKEELESAIISFENIANYANKVINYDALKSLISKEAHLNFKNNFPRTKNAADALGDLLSNPSNPAFRRMFERVISEGNWEQAFSYAFATQNSVNPNRRKVKPWAVLVTGLNGIRKTTSINSSWFQKILFEALQSEIKDKDILLEDLPDGTNSFFRQLDFIVATIANNEFKKLYDITDVSLYANLKNAIFSRYRTLAEICGIHLVSEAVKKKMNVLIETSGRDIAMFEYVDFCFPSSEYNKLLVHFTINDIKFAEKSVDTRMLYEMKKGKSCLDENSDVNTLIEVNAGGPYGSAQLKSVQEESDKVIKEVISGHSETGRDWLKAHIKIEAFDDEPWTARAAIKGSQTFTFMPSIVFKAGRADIRREIKY